MKQAFKGDGTEATGKRIIKALEDLGGKNLGHYNGTNTKYLFYYIDSDGNISHDKDIPEGYTLCELPDEKPIEKTGILSEEQKRILESIILEDGALLCSRQHQESLINSIKL